MATTYPDCAKDEQIMGPMVLNTRITPPTKFKIAPLYTYKTTGEVMLCVCACMHACVCAGLTVTLRPKWLRMKMLRNPTRREATKKDMENQSTLLTEMS